MAGEEQKTPTKRAPRAIWIATGAVVLAGVTGAWLLSRGPGGNDQPTYDALTCSFEKGMQRSYGIALEARSKVDARQLLGSDAAGKQKIQDQVVRLDGSLHMTALETGKSGATLAMRFEPNTQNVNVMASPDEVAQLQKPVLVKVDALCEFDSFGFAEGVGPNAQNQLRGILQSAQVVLGKEATAAQWQHIEGDLSGRYGARYTRVPGEERSLRKVKYGYVEVFPPVTSGARGPNDDKSYAVQVRSSDTKVHWSADGAWFDELASVERLMFENKHGTFADVTSTLTVKRLPKATAVGDVSLANAAWVDGKAKPTPRGDQLDEPPSRFKTMTIEEAMRELATFMQKDPPDHAGAGHMLAFLMRAQPDLIPKLMDMVRSDQIPELLHSAFFFGLELTGTPEARAALVFALDDAKLQPKNRMRAAAALADIKNPDGDTLAALQRLADVGAGLKDESDEQRVQNSAAFAIGTIEHNMRDKNPALAKEARTTIRKQLEKAGKDAVEITAALDAIHNSGNPEFIPDLKPYFKSDTELVRKHAYEALGRMPPEDTAPLFEDLLKGEQTPQQRALLAVTYADAARTHQVPPPAAVWNAAASELAAEQNGIVRASYVHLIGAAAESSPEAVATLAEQYKRESDPRMLKTIGRYVPADKLP